MTNKSSKVTNFKSYQNVPYEFIKYSGVLDVSMFYTNANSLFTKLNEFHTLITQKSPVFIFITETWANSNNNTLLSLPEYTHFQTYREEVLFYTFVIT